ncbi:hypothetical protein BWQ96_01275 [Gracilariopsis chorda]|uniref:Uncharacterized protein n=1 Tax=Gracilariopsis chorda TaxID=448386 RepID=A0A2V3J3P4_9FLOR|nr:hypothetical protein BWQ96_01275 [Gracilariopsis chorda]|eukprot:PXF48933.1 hypothetical protein BWQ96_01275 [Gracilariopsis chorda]
MSTNNVIDDPLLAGLSRLSTSRNRPQVNIQIDRKTQTVSSQQPPPKSSAPSSASPAASAEHPQREQVDPARRATNAGGLSAFSSNAEHSSSSPRHFRRSTSDASSQQASDSFSKHGSTQFEQPSQHLRPTVKPLIPLHRSDTCELIERTTGLGRPSDGDPSGAERLLQLIRNGSLPPHTVLEYIVAGSGPNEVKVNARVLWLMHYLMVHGGPDMVPEAVQPFRKRNAPALHLVLAVLRSFGYIEETDALDVLQDDEKVRAMTLSTDRNNVPTDSLQRSWGKRLWRQLQWRHMLSPWGEKCGFIIDTRW